MFLTSFPFVHPMNPSLILQSPTEDALVIKVEDHPDVES